jgi:hypothetical protein
MPIVPQQRQRSVLLPKLRHYGGCPRVCRRLMGRKIRNSVARPVLTAVHFGDKWANFCQSRQPDGEKYSITLLSCYRMKLGQTWIATLL